MEPPSANPSPATPAASKPAFKPVMPQAKPTFATPGAPRAASAPTPIRIAAATPRVARPAAAAPVHTAAVPKIAKHVSPVALVVDVLACAVAIAGAVLLAMELQ